MKLIKVLILVLVALIGQRAFAQEGVAPLWGNDKLQAERSEEINNKTASRASNNIRYEFALDTNILPIVDDFSVNYFKKYDFDTANTVTDTLVWFRFLVDGQYQLNLQAMFDTSYTYQEDPVSGDWDSIANPMLQVVIYSDVDYLMPIDTDSVWVMPDSILVGAVKFPFSNFDTSYINYLDSVIIVPDTGYTIWRNSNVLRNYTYGKNPVTLGVATFDGLDSNGVPYDPTMNPNSYQIADILESKPINFTIDSTGAAFDPFEDTLSYLSFFYQPEGLGDAPEIEDSLVLQFYSAVNKKWVSKWKAEGSFVKDFKYVKIPIKETIYTQSKEFKFRFLNYASVTGNFDHWNIDYVHINAPDEQRLPDSVYKDVALLDQGVSLLVDYDQMPWSHYKANSANLMKTEQPLRFRNLFDQNVLVNSQFKAYEDGTEIFAGSVITSPIVAPFETKTHTSVFSDSYPDTSNADYRSFHVIYEAQRSPDDNLDNNFYDYHQQFGTQYAYDDGSAESAYFVTSQGAQIVVDYNIVVTDSLRAINLYLPRSFENILDRSFRLVVYDDDGGEPGALLYESFLYFPIYSPGRDFIIGYNLEEPLEVSGKIYVGIKQTDGRIFIGMDKNNNTIQKNWYNVGGGWQQSSFPGSLFIRPEFGLASNPWPVKVEEVIEDSEIDFNVYPNPGNSYVILDLPHQSFDVQLISISGVSMLRLIGNGQTTIDVSNIPPGLYLVDVSDQSTGVHSVKKLLIQH